MNIESVIYLTNIVIGVILSALMTHYWREQRHSEPLRCWALAAWIMTVADGLFALRPAMPYVLNRLAPTLTVTVGLAVLLQGALRSAGLRPRWRLSAAVFALHAAGLVGFIRFQDLANFRMPFNGLIWGGFSVAAALCLRRGPAFFSDSVFSPASAFWAHAAFHGLRVVLSAAFAAFGYTRAIDVLQIAGDLEVSFFMVALFVGLLIAHLRLRHDELMHARADVQTLTGLLPICAWCKKVRDDDGYWQQVEEYFSRRSGVKFTHGVCAECRDRVHERELIPHA